MKLFIALVLWCLLLFFCWPLAILVLILFPIIWLLLLPLRLAMFALKSFFALLRAILRLPAHLIAAQPAR